MMNDTAPFDRRFDSQEDLRQYVEAELDRTVRAEWPEIEIDFGPQEFSVIPRSTPLCWLLESRRPDVARGVVHQHYLLEAHLSQGQFVVWFGALHGFPIGSRSTRDVMLPAVHVPFSLVHRDERPTCEPYGLGAVLEWMLEHRDCPEPSDRVVFPMNGHQQPPR